MATDAIQKHLVLVPVVKHIIGDDVIGIKKVSVLLLNTVTWMIVSVRL